VNDIPACGTSGRFAKFSCVQCSRSKSLASPSEALISSSRIWQRIYCTLRICKRQRVESRTVEGGRGKIRMCGGSSSLSPRVLNQCFVSVDKDYVKYETTRLPPRRPNIQVLSQFCLYALRTRKMLQGSQQLFFLDLFPCQDVNLREI
jgi:hypothetical protein